MNQSEILDELLGEGVEKCIEESYISADAIDDPVLSSAFDNAVNAYLRYRMWVGAVYIRAEEIDSE